MLLSMLLTFSIFWIGTEIYKRRNLPTFVDSLRDGRFHYFLLGLVLSLPLQGHEQLFRFGEGLRYTVLGMGLVWLGFQTGLEFEIRNSATIPWAACCQRPVKRWHPCSWWEFSYGQRSLCLSPASD